MSTSSTRLLNWLFLLTLISTAFFVAPLPVQAASGPTDSTEMAAFLDGVMASQMAANHIAGAVIAVVQDGKLVYTRGYGFANVETSQPVDPERTLFRPGSISKLYVWTSVMQLVEQGKLDLDADVNAYLDFKIPATYAEPITLKNLLTHTPGFEDQTFGLFTLDPAHIPSLGDALKARVPARILPPGKYGAYSNYGAALAGYIVERVSGLPFAEYVEKNIYAPLGMTHSTFRQPLPQSFAVDMSSGYSFSGGSYIQGDFEIIQLYPAGSMSTTAADQAKFMLAHLQNGRLGDARILREETAIQMHSMLFSHDPQLGGMAYGFFDNTLNGQTVLSHGGDTLLFHSGLFLLPAQNIGIYVSTNTASGGEVGSELMKAFMQRYYPAQSVSVPAPAPDLAQRVAPYLGSYTTLRSNMTGVEKLMALLNPANVSLSGKGELLVTFGGQILRGVEVAPGVFQDLNDPNNRIALRTEGGRQYVLPALPFAYVKTPWYATPAFQGLLLGLSLILFLCTPLSWLFAGLGRLRRKESRPALPVLARWTAVLFAVAFLVFVVGFFAAVLDFNPAYGVPNLIFATPPSFPVLFLLPKLMVLAGLGMLVFAILAWIKRFWTGKTRLYYTFLTLLALAMVWVMYYWNMLL